MNKDMGRISDDDAIIIIDATMFMYRIRHSIHRIVSVRLIKERCNGGWCRGHGGLIICYNGTVKDFCICEDSPKIAMTLHLLGRSLPHFPTPKENVLARLCQFQDHFVALYWVFHQLGLVDIEDIVMDRYVSDIRWQHYYFGVGPKP
jgi:hypothetical protein